MFPEYPSTRTHDRQALTWTDPVDAHARLDGGKTGLSPSPLELGGNSSYLSWVSTDLVLPVGFLSDWSLRRFTFASSYAAVSLSHESSCQIVTCDTGECCGFIHYRVQYSVRYPWSWQGTVRCRMDWLTYRYCTVQSWIRCLLLPTWRPE